MAYATPVPSIPRRFDRRWVALLVGGLCVIIGGGFLLTSSGGASTPAKAQPSPPMADLEQHDSQAEAQSLPVSAVSAPEVEVPPAPAAHAPAVDPSTVRASRPDVYVVKSGDTLQQLANGWGTSVDAIVSLNGLANPSLILAGQTLKVPPR